MKISNLAVVFIAITLPVILLLSAYIETQIDTLSLQTIYDSKLSSATYDGISALKINTINNDYSTVQDSLIRDVKACISTFTNSLSSSLGLGGTGENYIMPYVPALVFTLYDGYYIYSPYEIVDDNGKTSYSHTLKPYVYYSEKYSDASEKNNIIICYSLDNYVAIYGTYADGTSFSDAGYLITSKRYSEEHGNEKEETIKENYIVDNNGNIVDKEIITDKELTEENIELLTKIEGRTINNSLDANNYYEEANEFTQKYNAIIDNLNLNNDIKKKLKIDDNNDPEHEDSPFTLEKRSVMQESIIRNLNQAMANYTNHSKMTFGLQEFSSDDWEKIYNNVCMISFLEGLPVGTRTYNNYSVIASTGNLQYSNKNQIYYIANGGEYYHRLGCKILDEEIQNKGNGTVVGYKSTDFNIKKKEITISQKINEDEPITAQKKKIYYYYKHNEKACYNCIVESNYEEMPNNNATKASYKAIGRIRYNLNKTSSYISQKNN